MPLFKIAFCLERVRKIKSKVITPLYFDKELELEGIGYADGMFIVIAKEAKTPGDTNAYLYGYFSQCRQIEPGNKQTLLLRG